MSKIDDLLANRNKSQSGKYIGVPDNYQPGKGLTILGPDKQPMTISGAPGVHGQIKFTGGSEKGKVGNYSNTVLYQKGAEWLPGAYSYDEIAQLQVAMVDAGLLDPDRMDIGQWDKVSRNAYAELLAQSNADASTWQAKLVERLQLAADGKISRKGSSAKEAPRVKTLTNPDDIKSVVSAKAPDLLGRNLLPGEQDALVSQYHQQESAYQDAGWAAQDMGSGTITQPPDVSSFVDQTLKDKYKTEVGANAIGQNGLAFMQMLQGQSGLPGSQS